MEGVFSASEEWLEKPEDVSPSASAASLAESQLLQHTALGVERAVPDNVDVMDLAKVADLTPDQVEQIMTGSAPNIINSKKLADSVLFDLSDEDRDLLEEMNLAGH